MKDFMKAACGLLLMYFILGSQMVGIFVGAKLAHTGSCTSATLFSVGEEAFRAATCTNSILNSEWAAI